MEMRYVIVICAIFFMLVSPALSVFFTDGQAIETMSSGADSHGETESEVFLPLTEYVETSESPEKEENKNTIKIYISSSGNEYETELEDYVVCVMCAEVPYTYEKEALKANAVAVRSYAVRRMLSDSKDALHCGADVCDDFSHCMAFITQEEATYRWGEEISNEMFSKIREAVQETKGQVLCYEDQIADCVFHSDSSGYTEDAAAVWGRSVPYLVSSKTPETPTQNNFAFTSEIFLKKCTDAGLDVHPETDPSEWLINIKTNSSGRVDCADLFGQTVSGKRIREIFSLDSTKFVLTYENGCYTFSSEGKGHGVGMSQKGSDALAKNGENYMSILSNYYKGTKIKLY